MGNKTHFLKLIGQPPGERGRATIYDPEIHCQMVRELAQRGEFQEAWASEIGITISTMREWIRQHEEFREAAIIAHQLLITYWTREVAKNVTSPDAKASMFNFLLKRFPAIYGRAPIDLQEWLMQPSATDGDPNAAPEALTQEHARRMGDDELEARLEALRKRREAEGEG